ncbi:hypothetical protein [Sulfolobus islandicus rod-shaped virus 2]|uniref:Uncharacterized protein n=1 Tax=Sulfolobus islandicus rod-shaped virus 2 TaxID=157899 RepID=Q8V9R1_SIRV2|nr:hypothetical protein SIRV2gp07 [Sulfolobus islandicus rod-shaped virus 2]CAC87282.1 hypothetical protein [Sulfolobus islandicus rod-shaped virus 2]
MSQKVEFPLNVELESQEEKVEFQVKKLYKFFNYVENYHNSKISSEASGNHLYLFIKDGELNVDYDGDFVIKAPSLHVSISIDRNENQVEINGNANGYEFKIKFVGKISVLARQNRVMLIFKVESLPEISRY